MDAESPTTRAAMRGSPPAMTAIFMHKGTRRTVAPTLETTRVKKDVIKQQQEDAAQKDAQNLLVQLKSDTEESKASEQLNKTTGMFRRFGAIPDIGNERSISEAAFLLSQESPLPEKPLKGASGYYVIRFKDRKNPDLSGLETEKNEIRDRLLDQKQMKAFNSLVTQLRSNSEISIIK